MGELDASKAGSIGRVGSDSERGTGSEIEGFSWGVVREEESACKGTSMVVVVRGFGFRLLLFAAGRAVLTSLWARVFEVMISGPASSSSSSSEAPLSLATFVSASAYLAESCSNCC